MCLKRKLLNQCILLPILWTLRTKIKETTNSAEMYGENTAGHNQDGQESKQNGIKGGTKLMDVNGA